MMGDSERGGGKVLSQSIRNSPSCRTSAGAKKKEKGTDSFEKREKEKGPTKKNVGGLIKFHG